MQTIRTDRAREAFVSVLAESCNVSEACRRANISRTAAYAWRTEDEAFAEAWKAAEDEAVDRLEQAAWDRATVGESDRMLEILLKAHRPEKYVERIRSELTGKDGGPIQTEEVLTNADAFTRSIASIASRRPAGSGDGEAQP